jgi:hypothetical protein
MDSGTIGILIAAASVLFGISYSAYQALKIDTNI